jgi:hypothetical protein
MISEVASKPFAYLQEETTVHVNQVRVGGVSVQFLSVDSAAIALMPPLDQFQVETDVPDIAIQVQWLRDLPMSPAHQLFDSGYTWRLFDAEPGFRFDFHAPLFGRLPYRRLLINSQFSQARLQMNENSFAGMTRVPSPLEYPLDELLIMHRLTQEKAIELHGVGIVGPDGASNLFVGHSGAGKSTTARLWSSLHDLEILSDDRIIVREDRVCEDEVREDANRIFMYGTPWHGEAAFALPGRAPLQRIFVLEHGHGNVLTRLTRSEMVAELFARSFVPFHRHEYVDSALTFLERVADSVPCYRYAFEPDQRAVERILNFHD